MMSRKTSDHSGSSGRRPLCNTHLCGIHRWKACHRFVSADPEKEYKKLINHVVTECAQCNCENSECATSVTKLSGLHTLVRECQQSVTVSDLNRQVNPSTISACSSVVMVFSFGSKLWAKTADVLIQEEPLIINYGQPRLTCVASQRVIPQGVSSNYGDRREAPLELCQQAAREQNFKSGLN